MTYHGITVMINTNNDIESLKDNIHGCHGTLYPDPHVAIFGTGLLLVAKECMQQLLTKFRILEIFITVESLPLKL